MPDPAGPKPHYRGGKKVTGRFGDECVERYGLAADRRSSGGVVAQTDHLKPAGLTGLAVLYLTGRGRSSVEADPAIRHVSELDRPTLRVAGESKEWRDVRSVASRTGRWRVGSAAAHDHRSRLSAQSGEIPILLSR